MCVFCVCVSVCVWVCVSFCVNVWVSVCVWVCEVLVWCMCCVYMYYSAIQNNYLHTYSVYAMPSNSIPKSISNPISNPSVTKGNFHHSLRLGVQ